MKIKLSELRKVIREVTQESINEVGAMDFYGTNVPSASSFGQPQKIGAVEQALNALQFKAFKAAVAKTLSLGFTTQDVDAAVTYLQDNLKKAANVLRPADLQNIAVAYYSGMPVQTLKNTGFENDTFVKSMLDEWSSEMLKSVGSEEKKPFSEKPAVTKLHAAMASKGIKPRY